MPSGLSPERVNFLERHPTARLQLEDVALAGGFLHFCRDWDGMLIDQTDPEFECCHCLFTDALDPKTGKFRRTS